MKTHIEELLFFYTFNQKPYNQLLSLRKISSLNLVCCRDIVSQEKKGGPYTKKQQEERRDKVNELYFEKGMSAVKIANALDVNRNIINEDIKLIYSYMDESIPHKTFLLLIKQIQRLEIQSIRLEEDLKSEKDFSKKITIEKMIFKINNFITQQYSKMLFR